MRKGDDKEEQEWKGFNFALVLVFPGERLVI